MKTQTTPTMLTAAAAALLTFSHVGPCSGSAGAAEETLPVQTAPGTPKTLDELRYIRVDSVPSRRVALEIAVQTFEREGAPKLSLVGVTHIADAAYYRQVQSLLDAHDLVLYESVKPAGTGGAGGETAFERVESSREAMKFLASIAHEQKTVSGAWPETARELRAFATGREARLAGFVDDAATDAWGNDLVFESDDTGFRVVSRGADGAPGGDGEDADFSMSSIEAGAMFAFGEDTLQGDLAKALGLEFQLEAINYAKPNWVCSDMSIDQVNRALAAKGLDFGMVGGTLAGSSLPAKLVKILLNAMKFADAFMNGAVSDTMKVVLVEMLGDEGVLEMSLGQMAGLGEVIIDQRNQVVVDDLEALLAAGKGGDSIAIFYGAGHNGDLGRRLVEQLEYVPTDTQWLRAIEIDLEQSSVTERDVQMVRNTIRRMTRTMKLQEAARNAGG